MLKIINAPLKKKKEKKAFSWRVEPIYLLLAYRFHLSHPKSEK